MCSRRTIADGADRLVTLVAARGERTVQLQHVARDRAGNGMDGNCAGAAEVADLLEGTLTSIP